MSALFIISYPHLPSISCGARKKCLASKFSCFNFPTIDPFANLSSRANGACSKYERAQNQLILF